MIPEPDPDATRPLDRTQPMKPVSGEEESRPRRAGSQARPTTGRSPFAYLLLWVLVVVSLLLNVVTLRIMLLSREASRQAVADAIAVIDDLQSKTFAHTVVIDQSLAIETDLPLDETIPVTIDQVLPVDTVVTVSVDAGVLGVIPLEIPIRTRIPINLTQDVVIDQTFHIETAIPVHLEVPINLSVAETPFYDTLEDLQLRLEALQDQLNKPLLPIPGVE